MKSYSPDITAALSLHVDLDATGRSASADSQSAAYKLLRQRYCVATYIASL